MDDTGFNNMNVIPLVDVMLVLLTIVLTTSTFIAVGAVPVELPKTSTADTTPLKTKTIEIDCNGNLYLEAQPVSLTALQESLGPLARSMPMICRASFTRASSTGGFPPPDLPVPVSATRPSSISSEMISETVLRVRWVMREISARDRLSDW